MWGQRTCDRKIWYSRACECAFPCIPVLIIQICSNFLIVQIFWLYETENTLTPKKPERVTITWGWVSVLGVRRGPDLGVSKKQSKLKIIPKKIFTAHLFAHRTKHWSRLFFPVNSVHYNSLKHHTVVKNKWRHVPVLGETLVTFKIKNYSHQNFFTVHLSLCSRFEFLVYGVVIACEIIIAARNIQRNIQRNILKECSVTVP